MQDKAPVAVQWKQAGEGRKCAAKSNDKGDGQAL